MKKTETLKKSIENAVNEIINRARITFRCRINDNELVAYSDLADHITYSFTRSGEFSSVSVDSFISMATMNEYEPIVK